MADWGPGLFQSGNDMAYVHLIESEMGDTIFMPNPSDRAGVVERLNCGLLEKALNRYLDPQSRPTASWARRDKKVIILGMMAMELGAIIKPAHLAAMRVLTPNLPHIFAQLQVYTALAEYKNNGTPWVLESLGVDGTKEYGYPFLGGGLGHSADEPAYPHTHSKTCMNCDATDPKHHCGRCKIARYCDKECQSAHWPIHKTACYKLPVRQSPTSKAGKEDSKEKESKEKVAEE